MSAVKEAVVQITCPGCHRKLNVPDDVSGTITCPACRQGFAVRSAVEAEPKAAPGTAPKTQPRPTPSPAPPAAPQARAAAPRATPFPGAVQVACPGCNRKLNVPQSAVGRSVICPACKGSVKVDKSLVPEAEDEDDDDTDRGSGRRRKGGDRRSRRGKGKKGKKGKKRIDVMPILLVGFFVLVGIGVALYFPMQKRTLRDAVSGGGKLGFNAAHAMARSPGEISSLCSIVETSPAGRMAAAGALALIARRSAADLVIGTIQERLKESLSPEARAAYAAALAQSRRKAGEEAAAELVTDGNAPVRLAVVQGLAHGKTDAAARAVGRALGDADEDVLDAAKGALLDWVVTDIDKAIAVAAGALKLDSDQARVAAARMMVALAADLGPGHVLPLLTSDSTEVRKLGLRILSMNRSLVSSGGEVEQAVVDLLDVDAQSVGVKQAALDVVWTARVSAGGPGSLAILKRDADTATRAAAARAVCVTRPEGTWAALTRPLLQDDAPRELRLACLEAMQSMGVAPEEKLKVVGQAILKLAENEKDETLAGMALIAMRVVADRAKMEAKYGAKQWKTWLARRLHEIRTMRRARRTYARLQERFEGKPDDAEKISKELEKLGLEVQEKVMENADSEDKGAIQNFVTEMVAFNRKLKAKKK